MGLFRPDRSRPQGEDPHLLWKVRLFVIGAGLGIWGMMAEAPLVLWVGIALLLIGVALRFRGPAAPAEDDDGFFGEEE